MAVSGTDTRQEAAALDESYSEEILEDANRGARYCDRCGRFSNLTLKKRAWRF